MAKRFIDTELWDKVWYMDLDCRLKCLVKMVRDKADLSGVWSPNWTIASAYIGEKVTEADLVSIDNGNQFVKLKNGKIYCIGFVEFQYGELSEKSPVHRKIISMLQGNGILDTYKIIGSKYPIYRVQEEEEDKEEDKDKEKDKEEDSFGKSENLLLVPEMFEIFKTHNPKYPGSKQKDYKPLFSIASYLCEQGGLPGSPDLHRQKILEAWEPICKVIKSDKFYSQKPLSTISNQIQEILQISLNGKPTGKTEYGTTDRAREYDRLFAERYAAG